MFRLLPYSRLHAGERIALAGMNADGTSLAVPKHSTFVYVEMHNGPAGDDHRLDGEKGQREPDNQRGG